MIHTPRSHPCRLLSTDDQHDVFSKGHCLSCTMYVRNWSTPLHDHPIFPGVLLRILSLNLLPHHEFSEATVPVVIVFLAGLLVYSVTSGFTSVSLVLNCHPNISSAGELFVVARSIVRYLNRKLFKRSCGGFDVCFSTDSLNA